MILISTWEWTATLNREPLHKWKMACSGWGQELSVSPAFSLLTAGTPGWHNSWPWYQEPGALLTSLSSSAGRTSWHPCPGRSSRREPCPLACRTAQYLGQDCPDKIQVIKREFWGQITTYIYCRLQAQWQVYRQCPSLNWTKLVSLRQAGLRRKYCNPTQGSCIDPLLFKFGIVR